MTKDVEAAIDHYQAERSGASTLALLQAVQAGHFQVLLAQDQEGSVSGEQERLITVKSPDGLTYLAVFTPRGEASVLADLGPMKTKQLSYKDLAAMFLRKEDNPHLAGFMINNNTDHIKFTRELIQKIART
ncbi:SseB family protein [Aerococcus sp. UMB1112A]|uniref:SseB family protein n=1 Tax=Aerococcus sp. UMB1112A TaxID=3050609 RepID=UPI00254E3343|nr:SseB family protein [Aerococcus sp. UMB1112A]MDK8502837.1 SseB family protein [Aerococcus sp. UMB1112A]